MPEYRRIIRPGGTFFLTLVTHERQPIFSDLGTIGILRHVVSAVKAERPFGIEAAVILPDHAHFIWTLPEGDSDFSRRVGRVKALFTKEVRGAGTALHTDVKSSRWQHRESDVWQRRFWEHTIRDADDFQRHLDYIHFNPVKHGLAACPHGWEHSSFRRWLERHVYQSDWCCACDGRLAKAPEFEEGGYGE